MGLESTQLLDLVVTGDDHAARELMPLIYDELRGLAGHYMMEPAGGRTPTLQPTALVHEAYAKLIDADRDFRSRNHFFAVAAIAMRQILVDYARGRQRLKRGGEFRRLTLTGVVATNEDATIDVEEIDQALSALAELDERASRVVELKFFGGLTEPEVAVVLEVSERTVRNDWKMARAWLKCQIVSTESS